MESAVKFAFSPIMDITTRKKMGSAAYYCGRILFAVRMNFLIHSQFTLTELAEDTEFHSV